MNRQVKVWRPPTDVFETDAGTVVRVELAGMCEGDFEIELVKRTLVVTGRRPDQSSEQKLSYQQMEIFYGDFRIEVHLPGPVEAGEVEATYRDGFLQVVLPKAKATRVPVAAKSADVEEPATSG